MTNEVWSAIVGAATATVLTVVWETVLKPRILARSLAELLAADLSTHAINVAVEILLQEEDPRNLPAQGLYTFEVFNAATGRLGELRRAILVDLIVTYRLLARLNAHAELAAASHEVARDATSEAGRRMRARQSVRRAVAVYAVDLQRTKKRLNKMLPELQRASRPWWWPPTWLAPAPRNLSAAEMREQIKAAEKDVAAARQRIDDATQL